MSSYYIFVRQLVVEDFEPHINLFNKLWEPLCSVHELWKKLDSFGLTLRENVEESVISDQKF